MDTDTSRFNLIRDILYKHTGIKLDDKKDIMIANRLEKLKRVLHYNGNIDTILEEVSNGNYLEEFINTFTTNKTHFFRECFHFEDLKNRVLPPLFNIGREISIYCSASSTGEEPYSIAISVLAAKEEHNAKNTRVRILATDIDTNVLTTAREGIYRFNTHKHDFPEWAQPSKYFKRRVQDSNSNEFLIKAKDELKALITFKQMNLMSPSYPMKPNSFDVIFCRNVLIYFSPQDQNKILKKLFNLLRPGGTLYLGHSENPLDLSSMVERLGSNIFTKKG